MTRIFFFLSFAWMHVFLSPGGYAQDANSCSGVIIDDFTVDSNIDITTSTVESYFSLPKHTCLNRDQLDFELKEGENRLRAQGDFKQVDINLLKGKQRDHYIVSIRLVPISTFYSGGLTRLMWSEDDYFKTGLIYEDDTSRSQTYGAYLGSRNLIDTGLKIDFEARYSELQRKSSFSYTAYTDNHTYEAEASSLSKEYEGRFYLNIFHPNILGTDFVSGITLFRMQANVRETSETLNFDYTEDELTVERAPETTDQSTRTSTDTTFKLGRRFGALTLLGIVRRAYRKDEDTSQYYSEGEISESTYQYREWKTEVGAQIIATSKSHLSIIDSGYYIKLGHSSTEGGEDAAQERLYSLELEYTQVYKSLALSPEISVLRFSYDGGDIFLIYRYGANLKYALSKHLIIEAEPGAIQYKAFNNDFSSFQRYAELKLSYVLPTFSYEFAFLFGEKLDFFEFDPRRVSE